MWEPVGLADLFNPPKPWELPEPRPSFVRNLMKTYGADDWMTPEQKREKKLHDMRENARHKRLSTKEK